MPLSTWPAGILPGKRNMNGAWKPSSEPRPFSHMKLESTVRYLGIEVDDALEMAEQTEV
jgi:hypothetical protein